ncbi:MAG: transglycosylase SLT domain-containing protein [Nitrospinaceae bacterium]
MERTRLQRDELIEKNFLGRGKMRWISLHKTLATAVLAVSASWALTGNGVSLEGTSPYTRALAGYHGSVFTKLKEARSAERFQHEARVQNKISRVIAKYKTGLKMKERIEVSRAILLESRKYGFDPLFLTAVIVTESSFNKRAKSKVGALGLMQILPPTARAIASETKVAWKGKKTLYDPTQNITMGAYYLNKLVERFNHMDLALEAYNRGPSKLARHLRKGIQKYPYSTKVRAILKKIRSEFI